MTAWLSWVATPAWPALTERFRVNRPRLTESARRCRDGNTNADQGQTSAADDHRQKHRQRGLAHLNIVGPRKSDDFLHQQPHKGHDSAAWYHVHPGRRSLGIANDA